MKSIDTIRLRKTVGWLGMLLPINVLVLCLIFQCVPGHIFPDSISQTYYYSPTITPFMIILGAASILLMCYRGYEKNGVQPAYPFGHGLTYTTFEYSDITVKPSRGGYDLTFTLSNTGQYDAAEVAQVYVGEVNPTVLRPSKELKAYKKVFVKAGESVQVDVHLPKSAFAFYDVDSHDWKINSGEFNIMVGASSCDIRSIVKTSL